MITLSSGIRSKAVVYTRGFGALFIWQAIPQAKWFARTQRFDNVRRTAGTTCRIITLRLRIDKSIGKSMRGPPQPPGVPPPTQVALLLLHNGTTRGSGALFIWQAIAQAKWSPRTQLFCNVRRTAGTMCRIITLLRVDTSVNPSAPEPAGPSPHPWRAPNPSRSLVASQRHPSGFWTTFIWQAIAQAHN